MISKTDGFISLTPSISESFVYLSAEKYLLGKTQYCNYKSLDSVKIVGSIMAPSIEEISKLNPTGIIILESQKKYLKLPSFLKTIEVDNSSLIKIFTSADSLAKLLKIKSEKSKNDLLKISRLKSKNSNRKEKSYISIVSANKLNENNVSFYISSRKTYYNDILSIFNLKNSCTQDIPTYQKQSLEYLEKTKPEIIFNFSNCDISKEIISSLSYKPDIITISTSYSSIPGPISVMNLIDTLSVVIK